jgi:hypothetical protein
LPRDDGAVPDETHLFVLRLPPWRRVLRAALPKLIFDGALPAGAYYLLHLAGIGDLVALAAGASVAAVRVVLGIAARRQVNGLAVFVLLTYLGSMLATVAMDDPRLLLVRDSVLQALAGAVLLATLPRARPLGFYVGRALIAAGEPARRAGWNSLWERVPRFRRALRILTGGWGTGLLCEGTAITIAVYQVPINVAVALGTALSAAALSALLGWTAWYVRRTRAALMTTPCG